MNLTRAGAQVSIQLTAAADLRPAEIDADQICQVLHNILLNARQSMAEGGIIEVETENAVIPEGTLPVGPGEYCRISIRDYGCGIAPENMPRIFDPYFSTKQAGRGLGLATAYAIVAKHAGCITVESKPGDVIPKPWTPAQLSQVLKRVLAGDPERMQP